MKTMWYKRKHKALRGAYRTKAIEGNPYFPYLFHDITFETYKTSVGIHYPTEVLTFSGSYHKLSINKYINSYSYLYYR